MPAEFPIAESPLADATALGAALGPAFAFSEQDVKFRHGERYASQAANRKFLGIPLGVYLGFTPSFDNDILTLTADSTYGVCFARIASQDDPLYIVDVFVEDDAVLDFSNHASFPVNVILRVNGALGLPHSAEIVTQTAAPTYPTEILLGVVTASNTIDVAEPFNRDTPFAYSGAPLGYGFMKDGAVEDLLTAIALNSEVATARTDLSGFTHPTLRERLDADGTAAAMADRFGKESRTFLGGVFVISAPTDSINVSRAFSSIGRINAGITPFRDFDGFASETRVGAITAGNIPAPPPAGALTDAERNVCAIIDATTEARFTDSARQVAYGRLTLDEFQLSGTEIVFTNASTTVTGIGTLFNTAASGGAGDEVEPGDIIQDPISGSYFEVDTVTSDTVLDIVNIFTDATTPASTAPALRRRFTLEAKTRTGPAAETPFIMPASSIRIYFNAWVSVEVAEFDWLPFLSRAFEESPIPVATTTVPGKAQFATGLTEGKAGSIFEVQFGPAGTPVGGNHLHSIVFDGVDDGGPGIVDVSQRGVQGDIGEPGSGGTPGPTGDPGPAGTGFTNFDSGNIFVESGLFRHLLIGSGIPYSFNTVMSGSKILFLTGGNKLWNVNSTIRTDDHWEIENIRVDPPGSMNVVIDARVPIGGSPNADVVFFLSAATE